jgi:hypothetical protein
MKVDLKLISAALSAVLERSQVAPYGAIPLRTLVDFWEGIRLRSSDLGIGIEELHRQGQIALEPRGDGLWIRRRGKTEDNNGTAYGRLREAVNGLVTGLALEQVQQRRPDGYAGHDRRRGRNSEAPAR